jgi:hypothetical protein
VAQPAGTDPGGAPGPSSLNRDRVTVARMPSQRVIALPASTRTDEAMIHGLAGKHRTDHLRRQIRGPALAPETLGSHPEPAAGSPELLAAADAVVMPLRASRPQRDGATRVGALVPLDQDKRASLAKPLAALGWDKDSKLIAEVHGASIVVRAGEPMLQRPWLVRIRISAGRLTLPPTVTGALRVEAGDQVLAVALPAQGELRIHAAADALQQVTGELEPVKPAAPERAGAGPPASRTRVRPAFGHTS